MDKIWETLVRDALSEAVAKLGDRAVSGSRFSRAIKQRADAAGLDFPPAPVKTFREFIESFPNTALVQRRLGRDILIAPSDRPELFLAEFSDSGANRIRDDFFNAFTRIPKNLNEGEPYYLTANDEVVWFTADTPKPEGSIKIPTATFDSEIKDRKDFIDSSEAKIPHEIKSRLSLALEDTSPLGAFSNVVRESELSPNWHRHRMSAILKRLRGWSLENGILWNTTWISEHRPAVKELPAAEQIAAPTLQSTLARDFLAALASVITEADMARIQMPLDLVARAWQAKRD